MARKYPALEKARAVPRQKALRKVIKNKQTKHKRPVFALKYDTRFSYITGIQAKHWRSMTQDPYMVEVFPQQPLTAFRRQNNLRDFLLRAKVPAIKSLYPQRQQRGISKCEKNCTACPYVMSGTKVRIKENLYWEINRKVNCQSFNVIYLIECDKETCKLKYIGQTGRIFKFRLYEHRMEDEGEATGAHFNLPGHSLANLKATVLEQVTRQDEADRKEREHKI